MSGPMEILYSFPLRIGRAGIGMTAWHQVDGLVRAGLRVHLVAGSIEKEIPGLRSSVETLSRMGLKLPISLIGNDRARVMHDRLATRHLAANAGAIEAVHCWPSGCVETLTAARRLGITSFIERPSSYTRRVLQVMSEECARVGVSLSRNHYAFPSAKKIALEEREFALADYLLCPSPFALRTHAEGGVPEEKLLLHQYGYDPAVFYPPNPLRRIGDEVRGLFVAEGSPLKGIHFALEAWFRSGLSERGTLTICGRILPEFREKLSKWTDHPSVSVKGFSDNVADCMRESDFLILPSLSEGSSLVTYEARACGCCILVSDASGAYCEHGETGLVHRAGDIDAIVSHMRLFLEDKPAVERIRSRALEEIGAWTWDAAVERLRERYAERTVRR